jgi:teichuronic acid biosynthesis glycosyltransferase TuaG
MERSEIPVPSHLPRVTTVIPCFNGGELVERAVDSALAQAGCDVRVIVVDDGSTDDSVARVFTRVAREPRLRVVCLGANRGAGRARNVGIERADSRYLAFLDHDDWWRPRKLALQVEALRASDAGLCYTAVDVHDGAGRPLRHRSVPTRTSAEQLLVHNVIAASSVLIDRQRVPAFRMPDLRRRQDLATWYRLLRAGVRAVGIDEPLTVYTRRRDSLSANKLVAAHANWRLYREHLGRPLPESVSLFARYAAAALRRA